ncbi:microtubule-binding protein MIP-T3-domain-containing protein [Gaertneriomyces semiglobifer]|nr:microtubule-binding protein MIP-T3-domain-containing protein [Gaertneriomyces semiglobifer]
MALSLEDSVKKSADLLGRIVKKTPLTPKLLSKPPFRYLHDLISEVLGASGFAQGLYDEIEANSENVKEKEAKVSYLTKIIDVVGMSTGVYVAANPLKIVAGLEPEETNAFLQLFAKAVLKKVDSTDAVRRVLAGEHQIQGGGRRRSSKEVSKESAPDVSLDTRGSSEQHLARPKTARRADREKSQTESGKRSDNAEESDRVDENRARQSRTELDQQEQPRRLDREVSQRDEGLVGADRTDDRPVRDEPRTRERKDERSEVLDDRLGETRDERKPALKQEPERERDEPPSRRERDEPPSRRDREGPPQRDDFKMGLPGGYPMRAEHDIDVPEEPIRVPLDLDTPTKPLHRLRPSTARPAPPRQRGTEVAIEDTPKEVQVFSDTVDTTAEDDFVVMAHDVEDAPVARTEIEGEKHGGLVRTILQTKQELEGGHESSATASRPKTAKGIGGKKELDALMSYIQSLTRSTNPLAKTLDYMQEDVDSMNRELEYWRNESQKYSSLLASEAEATQKELRPLEDDLHRVNSAIEEHVERIGGLKAGILQTEAQITNLLRTITKTS